MKEWKQTQESYLWSAMPKVAYSMPKVKMKEKISQNNKIQYFCIVATNLIINQSITESTSSQSPQNQNLNTNS